MTMPEEYSEYETAVVEEVAPVAPAPFQGAAPQWEWTTDKLLWSAGIVLGLGFGVWFLMSYTGARAKALTQAVTENAGA